MSHRHTPPEKLTFIKAFYLQRFKTTAIVHCKTKHEYFLYLFEPWDCIRPGFLRLLGFAKEDISAFFYRGYNVLSFMLISKM